MKLRLTTTVFALAALALSSCSSSDEDPLATSPTADAGDGTITIGTANFPESEIIGQIWAAALEDAGFDVEVTSGIGSREVYLKALEEGSIDLVPEYSGNLAQYYGAELESGASAGDVAEALADVLPAGLVAGDIADGESKDSYRVTRALAEEHGLTTLADLDKLDRVRIAANPEFAERPYGPPGLASVYGVDAAKISVVPISDGGGPLTVAAVLEGAAEVADIYTTSPLLDAAGNEVDLVTLEDPEQLILPQNVLPLMRADAIPQEALDAVNGISGELTTDALVALNLRNIGEEKAEPPVIARDFVADKA
ncbi:putative substrate-binding protein [Corynebacterium humireducens NBRC 106098 = DSM 45392]|uniref:Putative substrate-binding protein n=1 Tax=Corynebacterium humireducens NBRC 106098 = DSM 45392 TaxID=1223515 RepID=A0A0B5D5R0_9CORY|nr:ABC transporter substrate-binding protein [Corynebacterium humireducens]AJE34171.1 putative substrate-binding protein [Corynebacterium humireducens NBRC 106098 = DSM 45392]